MKIKYHIDTQCVQEGYHPKNGEPRVLPITQSTTFKYDSAEELGRLFDLQESGFFYTRLSNPTIDAVEKKIAALESGVGAMLTSSGQAAVLTSILNICQAGDHILCTNTIYGGTFNLFQKTLQQFGIQVTFIHPFTPVDQIKNCIQENTKCLFTESLSNPSLIVADLEKYATIAHQYQIPLIVDNTFPTPIHCRPIEFGADIVIHSTTKYMDGHAVSLGGVIVDGGTFHWKNSKFPEFTTPDKSYHGIIYSEHFGKSAYIAKARAHLMRDLGVQISPMNAFLLNLGLETLALRMERHCSNAEKVAKYLKKHKKIAWINYPSIPDSPSFEQAQKYMPNGTCGVIIFGIEGGTNMAKKFMENLRLSSIVTHVADTRTCVLHPASTTHRQMSEKELEDAGISSELIRMSIGIEHVDDIIDDIDQALHRLS